MIFNKERLLTVCAGFAVLLFAAAAHLLFFKKPKTGGAPLGVATGTPAANIPENAFLPNPPQSSFDNPKGPNDNSASETPSFRTENSSIEYRPPSFQRLKDFFARAAPTSTAFFPSSSSQATVTLPSVSDAEISVDPQGAATAEAYVAYFATHYNDIQFDNRKLESVLKDENNLPFLPLALIDKGIQDNNFSEVRDSLLVYREFIQARIAFLKTIKVSGGAVALDKKTIAFDMLTLSLIDKTSAVAPGTPSENDFKVFFAGFKAKAFSENQNLLKTFGVSALLRPANFFSSLLDRFDLPAASAQVNEPFGGQIGLPVFCGCDAGFLVEVGPPVPPKSGYLFVPIASISSPLFFPFKSLVQSSWWLGLDLPTSIPCLVYVGLSCVNQGNGSLFFMAGTSLPSGGF